MDVKKGASEMPHVEAIADRIYELAANKKSHGYPMS